MKKMQQLLLAIMAIAITSCVTETVGPVGPPGPQGPEGPVGAPGENAFVFEYAGVDFLAPDYEVYLDYPVDFEGLDSDVALVYLLWDVTTDSNGNDLEIWRQMPQSLLTPNGLLMYNFDFSKIDVHLFLAAEFSADLLEPIDTDDWVVRVVVVPGTFWGRTSVDHSDYDAVKEAYGLPDLQAHTAVARR